MGVSDSSMSPAATPRPKHHRVRLGVTPLVAQMPAMPAAYHTSITVDEVEYTFTRNGIVQSRDWGSHRCIGGKGMLGGPGLVIDLGITALSGRDLLQALRPHFWAGTYDLLRKNCNSFSDCAIYFLLGRRLDERYAVLEQIAAAADETLGLVQFLSHYSPNPKATGFEVDDIVARLTPRRLEPQQVQVY